MPHSRKIHAFSLTLLVVAVFTIFSVSQKAARGDDPRVAAAYTAWDDYYLYAAFEINDHNVISTNRTPSSQPQEDDNVEVFLDLNPSANAKVRTPDTYQMAVSAGSGAYFSQGNGTKIPVGKLVLTYKYAVTIDGTLNNPNDNDTGYTVELAIPWEELGLTGPPASGQTWGFNVISRNRESLDTPAQSFVSLSPNVLTRDDIQVPSKWTKIQFISTLANQVSSPALVYCPRVTSDTNYPIIDGVVRDGEWNTAYGFSFGDTLLAGAAPTQAEEPNITDSPFATLEQPVIQTPITKEQPLVSATPTSPDYTLALPGGGEVHVGKLPPPPVDNDIDVTSNGMPLPTVGPDISPDATLSLVPQTNLAPLILAPYYYAFDTTAEPTTLTDQPIDGISPSFGGSHSQWQKNQLIDARRAGVDVLLPVVDPSDSRTIVGLSTLVEAMKELKAADSDFPLLGLKVKGADVTAAVGEFLTIVPQEFRAEVILPDSELNKRAYVVVVNKMPNADTVNAAISKEFNLPETLFITTDAGRDYLRSIVVSPGGWGSDGSYAGRGETSTLTSAWQTVYDSSATWVFVNSWNDFEHGTEIAGSRQYGDQYIDQNRLDGLKWAGADEWDAKYLQNDVPNVIAQKTIYTVSIRVENNGSLPWRAGEDYSLGYRWYKDGRLYDDSSPKLPLTSDVYPGESTTIKVGLFAQNSYGTDIEPGRYTLVFDMLQGQDRWFSYVGERPLAIPVRVEDPADSPQTLPVVLGSTTPALLDTKGTYMVTLTVRNEGQETWLPGKTSVSVAGNLATGSSTLDQTVYPGAIGNFTLPIHVPASAIPGKLAELDWTVTTPGGTTTWSEHPLIVQHDLGVSFSINDVPRIMKTGDLVPAKIAVTNGGPYPYATGTWKIDYEWLYLDGVPAIPETTGGALDAEADPGTETAAAVNIETPKYPGKYQLVFGLKSPDGTSTLNQEFTRGDAILDAIVSVTADKNAAARTVDLTKYFTTNGLGFESVTDTADFDGTGGSLPAVDMPPDGTEEVSVDPLTIGKPGPPEYPSGYYSSTTGVGTASNHRIAFLFGAKGSYNIVASNGQQIQLPGGDWNTIHILAASTGTTSAISAQFGIGYKDGTENQTVQIANWTKVPDPSAGTVALRIPYHLEHGLVVSSSPVFLGDYALTTDSSRHVQTLVLPTNPTVKVLAITVER